MGLAPRVHPAEQRVDDPAAGAVDAVFAAVVEEGVAQEAHSIVLSLLVYLAGEVFDGMTAEGGVGWILECRGSAQLWISWRDCPPQKEAAPNFMSAMAHTRMAARLGTA